MDRKKRGKLEKSGNPECTCVGCSLLHHAFFEYKRPSVRHRKSDSFEMASTMDTEAIISSEEEEMPDLESCEQRRWTPGEVLIEKKENKDRGNYHQSNTFKLNNAGQRTERPMFGTVFIRGRPEIPEVYQGATE